MVKKSFLFVLISFVGIQCLSQVSVVNVNFNEYNISPSSLSQVTINSISGSGVVVVEGKLFNAANEILLQTKSTPLSINGGVNIFGSHNLEFSQFIFSGSPQGEYISKMHRLPTGAFTYCVTVLPVSGFESSDEYCQSVDAEMDEQLFLVNPYDGEEIPTTTPILIWSHTSPFSLLSSGEFFRMKVVELATNQDPTEGMVVNTPIYFQNYLEKHQVQYPLDATALTKGKRYAWQVEKVSNGSIIAVTEVWEFKLAAKSDKSEMMYVALKEELDGSVYVPEDDRIYFRYDERYKTSGLNCVIYSETREIISPQIENEQQSTTNTSNTGYNSFELDLKPYHLKKGYYTLEVKNQKGKVYRLKFVIE